MIENHQNSNQILLISPDFPPPFIGGSLVYMHNLITNSNLNYDILSNTNNRRNDDKLKYIESKYIVNSQAPSRYGLIRMYLFIFFLAFRLRKYKVVILNIGVVGNGLMAYLLNFLNVKTIIISYAEEITMTLFASGVKSMIKKIFLGFYKKTNGIVSVSNFAKNILIKDVKVSSPIFVIPTPLHNLKYSKTKKNSLVIENQALSVGRLIKRKGFSHLISSFKLVLESLPEAKLIIVGDGPDYRLLVDQIESLKLGDSVTILKNINDKQLANLYRESRLFVLANLLLDNGDCEGAPNVLVEAASFGLPSIAGVEGGTSDVVENDVSGYLINPLDHLALSEKIITLATDNNLRNKMSNNCLLKVEKNHNQVVAGQKFRDIVVNI
jgi:glycosyltransferase involved in cell wall biosynthesis